MVLLLYNNVHEKLGASDWLKTSAFSCDTSAKFVTRVQIKK